eukprot:24858_1
MSAFAIASSVAISWAISDVILLILCSILLYCTTKWFYFKHDDALKTTKLIKIVIISWLSISCISHIAYIITDIHLIYNRYADPICCSSNIIGDIFEVAAWISIGFFSKLKLQQTFKHKYFEINKSFLNILFIIYSISLLINRMFHSTYNYFSYINKNSTENSENMFIAMLGSIITNMIYFGCILFLFNIKLDKFISLTINNNYSLSLELNNKLKYVIVKQTNLISIIFASVLVRTSYYIIYHMIANNHIIIQSIAINLFIISQCILLVCVALTFNINDKYYAFCCKYCHSFCIKIRYKKYTYKKFVASIPLLTYDDHHDENINLHMFDADDDQHICFENEECQQIEFVCKVLKQYQNDQLQHLTMDILNAFHHLLLYHDSSTTFNYIYNKLTQNDKHCDYMVCKIHSRYYSQRKRNINTINYKQEQNTILDKIHSFYYHSYDTSLRSLPNESTDNIQ